MSALKKLYLQMLDHLKVVGHLIEVMRYGYLYGIAIQRLLELFLIRVKSFIFLLQLVLLLIRMTLDLKPQLRRVLVKVHHID